MSVQTSRSEPEATAALLARAREIAERETATLLERTPESARLFERARRILPFGVASSFQKGFPYPVYLSHGRGSRVWDRDIGGSQGPWVAGDFVYVLDNNGELICLTRDDGRIRWIQSLPKWEDEEDQEDPIFWAGPVLAGNRLVLVSSRGQIAYVSPTDGSILSVTEEGEPMSLAPVVANNTLYTLDDAGRLTAWR